MIVWIVGFTRKGCGIAERISNVLGEDVCRVFSKTSADITGTERIECSMNEWTCKAFETSDAVIFVGAAGIAVRYIAPFLKNKGVDPAVIVVDDMGSFVVPIVSGHIGGANALAKRIASGIGAIPVITTATDRNGKFSVDSFAVENDMHIGSMALAKDISAAILDGRQVGLFTEVHLTNTPSELTECDNGELGIFISPRDVKGPFIKCLKLTPRCHVLGIGSRKGISAEDMERFISDVLRNEEIAIESVRAIGSIDLKKDEGCIIEFGKKYRIPCEFFTSEELAALPDIGYTGSEKVRSVTGVDNVCERAAMMLSRDGALLVKKISKEGKTLSISKDGSSFNMGVE